MGWCSGTDVFDVVCEAMFKLKYIAIDPDTKIVMSDTKNVIKELVIALEMMDWDCQKESDVWNHPIVQEVFKEIHPDWFKKQEWG